MSLAQKFGLCLLAAVGLTALSGCQSPAVYQPRSGPGEIGYFDQQLTANRYRVTFTGNSATHREAVEDYLMRRAAEVTLAAGHNYFLFDARDTKADTRYHSDFMPSAGGWCCRRWGGGMEAGMSDSYPITSYEAYAEIILLTDEQAENDPHAIDARSVLEHLRRSPADRKAPARP